MALFFVIVHLLKMGDMYGIIYYRMKNSLKLSENTGNLELFFEKRSVGRKPGKPMYDIAPAIFTKQF